MQNLNDDQAILAYCHAPIVFFCHCFSSGLEKDDDQATTGPAFGFYLSESEVTEEGNANLREVLHVFIIKQEIVDLEVNCSPIASRSLCISS
jgi:hypothetical protein